MSHDTGNCRQAPGAPAADPPSPPRALAEIPIGGEEYRQIDRVVREIDGLAEILIGDVTHYHQKGHSIPVPDKPYGGG